MELGQRLKQARLDAGLSQRQLCGDAITRNMLSQIENGAARPSMETLRYLAGRLGKPVSFFLEENIASPNQPLMEAARSAYREENFSGALAALADFQSPDPVLEAEYHLLAALCCMALARNDPAHAAEHLARAGQEGAQTVYYTPELERTRLLLLAEAAPERCADIIHSLPADDRELLLRAKAALLSGDPARCAALLEAAQNRDALSWLLLRGDAAMAAGELPLAAQLYRQAEPADPQTVWPKLEQCCLQMEDYKMAYHYACLQRSSSNQGN